MARGMGWACEYGRMEPSTWVIGQQVFDFTHCDLIFVMIIIMIMMMIIIIFIIIFATVATFTDRMNGNGTLTSLEGSTYGDLWNGMRHGQAEETLVTWWGWSTHVLWEINTLATAFVPIKALVCVLFRGRRRICCQDGRKYVGQWKKSMRHGDGHQYYLREGDVENIIDTISEESILCTELQSIKVCRYRIADIVTIESS